MRRNTFLYIPNIIGYLRILLAIGAFWQWEQSNRFFLLYLTSFLLDAADGYAARYFHQSSELGALLDMLTDRCATAALLTLLSHLYKQYVLIFLFCIVLDGFSHWLQMIAGLASGTTSHKQAGRFTLLKIYYWRPVLTLACLLNELCFLCLYLLHFLSSSSDWSKLVHIVFYVSLPICILKQFISLLQVWSSYIIIFDTFTST
ncbi:CDP-diacylglycerol--inositol 3-phosphatidyltransferase isoform 1 [Galdieria sulphuraria]|uniref:CDP-diacylglycerol--inositol 3-phosphatidyltransferase n=1 Tax=Galdieria sulphuraria TaxID=130081 RepID=M2WU38_GALSU|nr:CDP-diacylglycerol--inositol 3-phosphatidyltransferase isoform 1 [Galdieria sulphuraria]EME27425.1 CDP-diacylglycerol--inositol 3-phosphatidyltransferase isoform 1 [Galdieria sulphuraria]|eukprot:XP_005703945.1 CDP-diacylglycerol--inositol 3-phosphatidyltransferase isoform 1 [Galdieria sulphuraria]